FRLCVLEFGARAAISKAKYRMRPWQNPALSISRRRRMRGQTYCFTRSVTTRWVDDDWQQNRHRHHSGDHMQRRGVVTSGLTHARDVERPEHTGEAPSR